MELTGEMGFRHHFVLIERKNQIQEFFFGGGI